MRDHPDTLHLLASARRALLQQVVPAVQGEAQGVALMLARALSVTSARLEADARIFAEVDAGRDTPELIALSRILGTDPTSARAVHGGTDAAIRQLGRQLALEIRQGRFDPPAAGHDALRVALLQITRAKLAENNPRALEGFDREPGEEE